MKFNIVWLLILITILIGISSITFAGTYEEVAYNNLTEFYKLNVGVDNRYSFGEVSNNTNWTLKLCSSCSGAPIGWYSTVNDISSMRNNVYYSGGGFFSCVGTVANGYDSNLGTNVRCTSTAASVGWIYWYTSFNKTNLNNSDTFRFNISLLAPNLDGGYIVAGCLNSTGGHKGSSLSDPANSATIVRNITINVTNSECLARSNDTITVYFGIEDQNSMSNTVDITFYDMNLINNFEKGNKEVAAYELNTNSLDTTPNNYSLTNNGAVYKDGMIASFAEFDGINDYMNVSNFPLSKDMSFNVWVNRRGRNNINYERVLHIDDKLGIYYDVALSKYYYTVYNGASWEYAAASSATSSLTKEWEMLTAVLNDSGGCIYLYSDGVLSGSSCGLTITDLSGNGIFKIGVNGDLTQWWNGSIDNVRIYNRALSSNEIASLYDLEKPPQLVSIPDGTGFNFSSVGGYLSSTNCTICNVTNKEYSFEFYAKTQNINPNDARNTIYAEQPAVNEIGITFYGYAGNQYCAINDFAVPGYATGLCATGLDTTQWNHVVFTQNSTNLSIYINGVLSKTGNRMGYGGAAMGALNYIGKWAWAANPTESNQTIDYIKIYNRSLDPAEVASHYLMLENYTTQFVSFYFKDEATNAPFNFSSPSSIYLSFVCNDSTQYSFLTNSSNVINPTRCILAKVKAIVIYPTDTYYRTILPSGFGTSTGNISNTTIYLLNLDTTQMIFNNFELYAPLGQYQNSRLYFKRNFEGLNYIITSDYMSIENKVGAYLMAGAQYDVFVEADNLPTRILGTYSADVGGDKIIRLFNIPLGPNITGPWTNDTWDVTLDNSTGTNKLRISYFSTDVQLASFYIYNNSENSTNLIYNTSSSSNSAILQYTIPDAYLNYSFAVKVNITKTAGHTNENKIFRTVTAAHHGYALELLTEGFVTWEFFNILAVNILGVIALLFSALTADIGALLIVVVAAVFIKLGWLGVGAIGLSLAMLVAVINFLKERDSET